MGGCSRHVWGGHWGTVGETWPHSLPPCALAQLGGLMPAALGCLMRQSRGHQDPPEALMILSAPSL